MYRRLLEKIYEGEPVPTPKPRPTPRPKLVDKSANGASGTMLTPGLRTKAPINGDKHGLDESEKWFFFTGRKHGTDSLAPSNTIKPKLQGPTSPPGFKSIPIKIGKPKKVARNNKNGESKNDGNGENKKNANSNGNNENNDDGTSNS